LAESFEKVIASDQSSSTPFKVFSRTVDAVILEKTVTIANEIAYLKTYSAYKTFKEAHPDDEDPVDRLGREMMRINCFSISGGVGVSPDAI
jgi:transcriptional regulator NrdR family protein